METRSAAIHRKTPAPARQVPITGSAHYLPQPALPEVSGCRFAQVARRARGGAASHRLLPCGLHAARRAARCGLAEQARGLRSADEGGGRDHARHRGRSQEAWCSHRHHLGAAYVGQCDDASSARAHDRAGRRVIRGRNDVDRRALQLPRARQRAGQAVPRQAARHAGRRARGRRAEVLQHARRATPTVLRSSGSSPRCVGSSGWSTARRPSRAPRPSCAISPATPTVWRYPTAGSSLPTTAASRSAGMIIGSMGSHAGRR